MDLAKYQAEATKTASPQAFTLAYLVPGIVGEVGEMFGQRAKSVWHGWSVEKTTEEIVLEYGDICWMTAVLLTTFDTDTTDEGGEWREDVNPWSVLLNLAGTVFHWYSDPFTLKFLPAAAENLWVALEHFCEAITGRTFDYVLQANLDKLSSRAQRGVLLGKGDHR